MTSPNPESTHNTFNISNSSMTNVSGSGDIHYQEMAITPHDSDDSKKTILFLAANPLSTERLRLDEEIREIEAGLQRAKHRDRFTLKQQWAVRPRDLQRAMLEHKPQIVHFSGHGTGPSTPSQSSEMARDIQLMDDTVVSEEELVFEDITGQPKLVSAAALASLFELFAESLECVVLNACYSQRQAEAIAQHVPYVIGMTQAIGDRAAIEFAVGFYDALGAGEAVEQAYRSALVAIRLAGISEHLTPVMIRHCS
ncbi:MAG: CHAT domain-containing protein [Phormidesmis sp.]